MINHLGKRGEWKLAKGGDVDSKGSKELSREGVSSR